MALARPHRLRTPAQFQAVGRTAGGWRAARRWVALSAAMNMTATGEGAGDLRIGVTVAKRHARRAVDRNRLKRVLREAARAALPALGPCAATRSLHVVLRLTAPLPAPAQCPRSELARGVRAEADALLAELARRCARRC